MQCYISKIYNYILIQYFKKILVNSQLENCLHSHVKHTITFTVCAVVFLGSSIVIDLHLHP